MQESDLRRLYPSQLADFFDACKRIERRSLAFVNPGQHSIVFANWYLTCWGWDADDVYLLDQPISQADLSRLVQVTSLQQLGLTRQNLGDAGVKAIADSLPNLQTLLLPGNGVGDRGAQAIAANVCNLQSLVLSNNVVSDAGAQEIAARLANLRKLDLGINRIGKSGARAIATRLHSLQELDLGNNSIGDAGARSFTASLPNLQVLYLNSNGVGDAGVQAIAEHLPNLRRLQLGRNNVGAAGARAIAAQLGKLEDLDLGVNHVGDAGAQAIGARLVNLHTLILRKNNVGDEGARAIADKLIGLCHLNLESNNVGEAGARAIADKLKNLRSLNLEENQLTNDAVRRIVTGLPKLSHITLQRNRALTLPEELLTNVTHVDALRDYFQRIDTEGRRKLNEAKLIIIGNESVGKTALVNFLIKDEPCSDTDKTPGLQIRERIEVTAWDTRPGAVSGDPLRLNVWDFGGQEVTRETHKLFLTARSLYLVVLEARRENALDAENVLHDWMRAIRHRGGETAPVIVVINKAEGDRELRLDETSLRKSYPIRAFIRTCCRGKDHPDGSKGILELRQKIVETIRKEIPQASAEFPVSYFEVKEKLREVAEAEHSFGIVRYTNICNDVKNRISDEEEQRRLLQLLVDIGVVIQHQETTLLDPNWLTTAIYRILTHSDVAKSAGLFRLKDVGKLLADIQTPIRDSRSSGRYPKDRWQYIVDQTVQCGLSFEIAEEPGTYLIPEQLSPNTLFTGLDRSDDPQVLRFRYDYKDIPKGLIPRFIVQMHRYLTKDRTCWANGVVLHIESCKILVKSERRTRTVHIYVHGPHKERREALRVVREGLERVHELFDEIGAEAMVPVNIDNHPDAAIAYSQLIEHERLGPDFAKIPYKWKVFDVAELLGGIAPLPSRPISEERRRPLDVRVDDRAIVHVNAGTQVGNEIDQRQTPSRSLGKPVSHRSGKTWLAPSLAALVVFVLVVMWISGAEPKWMALLGIPTLAGAVVHLVAAYFETVRENWARRNAGICLTLASACMIAPSINLLVEFDPNSRIKLLLDNAAWPATVAMFASCFFGWLHSKKEALQVTN